MHDGRRKYYDHEPAYARIASRGGAGWDDLTSGSHQGSYDAIDAFLASPWCPTPSASLRALDVGCGGGQVAIRLARLGFVVTAIDFSETAVALATRNAEREGVQVDAVVADCVDLARFDDGSFDLVVDNHVLHCLNGDDRLAFLRSASRVLRVGGLMFSDTMCHGPRLDVEAYEIDPTTRISRHHTRFWATPGEIHAEFTRAGLEIVDEDLREVSDEPNVGRMMTCVLRRV